MGVRVGAEGIGLDMTRMPGDLKALAEEVTRIRDRKLSDDTWVGMSVTMPDGSLQVVMEKAGTWRKWFQDGTIVLLVATPNTA